jgi:hypothetical protein
MIQGKRGDTITLTVLVANTVLLTTLALSTARDLTVLVESTARSLKTLALSTARDLTVLVESTSRDLTTLALSTARDLTVLVASTSRDLTTLILSTSRSFTVLVGSTSRDLTTLFLNTTRTLTVLRTVRTFMTLSPLKNYFGSNGLNRRDVLLLYCLYYCDGIRIPKFPEGFESVCFESS